MPTHVGLTVARRVALLIATDSYQDGGLRRLTAPGVDVQALAAVLGDPDVAGFEVTTLVNEPHHRVGEALGDFCRDRRRDDLTLLYFTGHGLKDDDGRLYLAMSNTRRDSLLFTALGAEQIDYAMTGCASRQQVLVLDCCYSGAFPAGRAVKADTGVHALERFQGRGRTVLTASDATQYSFEGDQLHGSGARSVFTRHLVEGLRSGGADLDGDGDITVDELYSYVHERVVEELPRQRPKIQTDAEGRTVIARNVRWSLPAYLQNALRSPIATDRLSALDGLGHLHRIGNPTVRARVVEEIRALVDDDSRSVSAAATARLGSLAPAPVEPPAATEPDPPEPARPNGDRADDPAAPEVPVAVPAPAGPTPLAVAVAVGSTPAPILPQVPEAVPAPTPARRFLRAIAHGSAAGSPDSGDPAAAPPDRPRVPVLSLIVLALASTGVIAMLAPTSSSQDTRSSLVGVGVVGLVFVGFDRRRDPAWLAAAAVNFAWIVGFGFSSGAEALRVCLLCGAGLNVAVCVLAAFRYEALGKGRWQVVTVWTAAVAVLLTVVAFVGLRVSSSASSGGAPVVTATAVSPDGHRLYLTRTVSSTVKVVDTDTRATVASIPVGESPVGAVLSPDGRRLYVSNYGGNSVSVVDTATNAVVGAPIPVGRNPQSMVISPSGTTLYVANTTASTISVVDTVDLTVVGDAFPIGLGSGSYLTDLVISPDGGLLYAPLPTSAIAVIAATSVSTERQIEVPNPYASELAVSSDGQRLYVGTLTGTLLVLDAATGAAIGPPIPVGQGPKGIAVSADGKRVYVGNGQHGVVVIDTATGSPVGAPITVPDDPTALTLSPDGSRLYVPTGFGTTVTVIATPQGETVGAPITVSG